MAEIERLAQIQESLRRDPHLFERHVQMQESLRRDPHLLRRLAQIQESLRRDPHLLAQLAEAAHRQFQLPQVSETASLLRELERSGARETIGQKLEIQRAMEAMRSPWLDSENRIQSITGFARLQDLGHALRTMPAFEPTLADKLRSSLGDWREPIDWPEDIFSDPLARADFYTTRGFDPTLTAFPAAAFDESITIAGLKEPISDPGETNDSKHEAEVDEEEAGFARTNAAHDCLQRFESKLRKFIDRQMQAAFGEDWIKHRIPGQIRQAWLNKQQKACDNRKPERPLIDYADFTDYVPIIIRKDNWQTVFQPIFKRPMLVQESFQRLYPIRNCVMHSNSIIQDDELYLHAETTRLLKAIKAR